MKELYEQLALFYLGKNAKDDSLSLYKSKHLTTHAAIIGMTGSGKTGLGIGLIEEAAIDNIPAIVIDPKGDMSNLCLAFAQMRPEDYLPWIDESEASAKGKTPQQLAEDLAASNKAGIESFGQDLERVKRFADVPKTIYTPGSSAGVGVDILGSFAAPPQSILEDEDTLASLINTTASSLLSLVSISSDSLNSKEHLLLSNIFNHYYTQGISLSMQTLISNIITPPFEKIGMLDLDAFYPQNERMKLATLFNSVISSVTFSSWIKGEPLNIQNMLYDENGKAKIAIFSIAHLSDDERMFFVTLLLNAYISWMRSQRGSSSLKSILYMDEIFGFFPPSKNPPSKEPMLLLLKQARAFGCGIILSTQNPVDIDYKGLSNIGTWFIGKLQTKQDIAKVIDGIAATSEFSKEELATQIATLQGRHFFLKNVHEEQTQEFYTRWVLSYLKGPMTKDDIKKLMQEKKTAVANAPQKESANLLQSTGSKPLLSQNIKEYFIDKNQESPLYPYLYAELKLSFFNQKKGIDTQETLSYKLPLDTKTFTVDWTNAYEEQITQKSDKAPANASYADLPELISKENSLKGFEKTLSDFIYETKSLELLSCKDLGLESKLGESKRDFLVRLDDTLKELREEKVKKLQEKFQSDYDKLSDKLQKLDMKLKKEQADVTSKMTDTIISVGMTLVSAFFGKKALSASTISKGASTLSKGKGVLKERTDVANAELLIDDVQEEMQTLEANLKDEIQEIGEELDAKNYPLESVIIKPRRSDISITDFALLWER
jgi:molybdopterin converting factor small subunit